MNENSLPLSTPSYGNRVSGKDSRRIAKKSTTDNTGIKTVLTEKSSNDVNYPQATKLVSDGTKSVAENRTITDRRSSIPNAIGKNIHPKSNNNRLQKEPEADLNPDSLPSSMNHGTNPDVPCPSSSSSASSSSSLTSTTGTASLSSFPSTLPSGTVSSVSSDGNSGSVTATTTSAASVPKIRRRRNYSADNREILHSSLTNVSICHDNSPPHHNTNTSATVYRTNNPGKDLPVTPRLIVTRSSLSSTNGMLIGVASPLSVTKVSRTMNYPSNTTIRSPLPKSFKISSSTNVPLRKTVSADSPRTKDSSSLSSSQLHHEPLFSSSSLSIHETTPKQQTGRHSIFLSYLLNHGQENMMLNLQPPSEFHNNSVTDNTATTMTILTNDHLQQQHAKRTGGGFLVPSLESKEPIVGQEAAKRRVIVAARRSRSSLVPDIEANTINQGLYVTGHTLPLQECPLTNSASASPALAIAVTASHNGAIPNPENLSTEPTITNTVIPRVTSFKRPRELVQETLKNTGNIDSTSTTGSVDGGDDDSVYTTTDSIVTASCTDNSLTESTIQPVATKPYSTTKEYTSSLIVANNPVHPTASSGPTQHQQASEWASVTFASPTQNTLSSWLPSSHHHISIDPFPSLSQYVIKNNHHQTFQHNNTDISATNRTTTTIESSISTNTSSHSLLFHPESLHPENNSTFTVNDTLSTSTVTHGIPSKKVNLKERARIRLAALVPTLTLPVSSITEETPVETINPPTVTTILPLPMLDKVTAHTEESVNHEQTITTIPPMVPILPTDESMENNLPLQTQPVTVTHLPSSFQHSSSPVKPMVDRTDDNYTVTSTVLSPSSSLLTYNNESPVKASVTLRRSPHSVSRLPRSPAVPLQALSIDLNEVSAILDGEDHTWNNTQSIMDEPYENGLLPSSIVVPKHGDLPFHNLSSPLKASVNNLPLSLPSSPIPLIASPHVHHSIMQGTSPYPMTNHAVDNVQTVPYFGYKTKSRIEFLVQPDNTHQESIFPLSSTTNVNLGISSPSLPSERSENTKNHPTPSVDYGSTVLSSIGKTVNNPHQHFAKNENEQNHSLAGTTTIMASLSPFPLSSFVSNEGTNRSNVIPYPSESSSSPGTIPNPDHYISLGYSLPHVHQIISVAICKTKIHGNIFTRHAVHTLHTVYVTPVNVNPNIPDEPRTTYASSFSVGSPPRYRYAVHHYDVRYRDILHCLEIVKEKVRIYSTMNPPLSSSSSSSPTVYTLNDKRYTVNDMTRLYHELRNLSENFPQKCLNNLAKHTLMERRKGIQRLFRYFITTGLIYTPEVMERLGFL